MAQVPLIAALSAVLWQMADDMLMLCVQVKKSLSVAYGRFPGYTFDKLSTDKLRRKLAFCREVRDCNRRVFSSVIT